MNKKYRSNFYIYILKSSLGFPLNTKDTFIQFFELNKELAYSKYQLYTDVDIYLSLELVYLDIPICYDSLYSYQSILTLTKKSQIYPKSLQYDISTWKELVGVVVVVEF
jgi:hypothetical protein